MDTRRIAVAIAGACAFLNLYPTHALLPLLTEQFHATPAEVGLTVTAGTAAVALTAPLTGALADMLGRKRIIVGAMLLVALPTLFAATSGSLAALLLWRFLQGICLPAIFAVTVAYVGEEWPPDEIGEVTAFYISGTVLGGFLGRFITAWAAEWVGWRGAFVVLAAIDVTCALAGWRWLPAARGFVPARSFGSVAAGMAMHLRSPRLAATFAVGAAVLFSLVALFTYANFHLAAPPFSLGTGALGSVFAVYLCGVVVTPWSGRFMRRHGRRLGAGLAVGCCLAGLALGLGSSVAAVVAGLALCCTGIFICQAAATGFIGAEAATARTAAVGLYVACYYLGGSLGAVVPAPLWSAFGWPGVVGLVAGVQIVMAALIAFAWQQRPA